jgi:2,5-furandicarboxylate decarboxylase 1
VAGDETLPATMRMGSAIGIDATFPFGLLVKNAGEPANVCRPALAEHGREYIEVADVPGWKDYDFPELCKRGAT